MVFLFQHQHSYYFTRNTLKSLLESSGFIPVLMKCGDKRLYSLSQNGKKANFVSRFEGSTEAKKAKRLLSEHINRLREELAPFLDNWRANNLKVAIWGAGGHTQYLQALTGLCENDIAVIVDKDRSKQGEVLVGFSSNIVEPPLKLKGQEVDVVVVSSYDYQEEIIEDIKKLNIKARILRIYPHIEYI